MKDCRGGDHDSNAPLTWWHFDREMEYRDELEAERRKALKDAIELRAAQLATSHRILVLLFAAMTIIVQVALYFRK